MKSTRDRVAVMAFKRKKSPNPNTFLAENGEGEPSANITRVRLFSHKAILQMRFSTF